jgi:DNA-binding transcriptional MerR regulator
VQSDHLSLEELSAAAGMTARNVRAYQTKGLIPPPTRRGRRSVYGAEHLQRLQSIERARARGASLALIAAHLAEGLTLDDDTLVDWRPGPTGTEPESALRTASGGGLTPGRADVGTLLAGLDHQRDAEAHLDLEQLITAGVFQRQGRRVLTARELAVALTALQSQGLPVAAALGVAQRALTAAEPLAESVRDVVREGTARDPAGAAAATRHLADVASSVVRQLVIRPAQV